MNKEPLTLYCILGVDRSATPHEIDMAYYRKAAEHHPDRGGDPDQMANINRAAMVLREPARREKYDKEIQLCAELCPSCDGAGRKWKQKGLTVRTAVVCVTCNGAGVLRWRVRRDTSAVITTGPSKATTKRKQK